MAGNVKLMTSAGGGVVLDTATTTATDVTVKVPVTGVNNGTLVCSDSSGNVGIGTTSNGGWKLAVMSATYGFKTGDGTSEMSIWNNGSVGYCTTNSNHPLALGVNGVEKARIDTSGNLQVGGSGQNARIVSFSSTNDLYNGYNGSTKKFAVGYDGQIYAVYTSIASLSDRRAKENIEPLSHGLKAISELKPVTFNYIGNLGNTTYGFIAQDVKSVLPELVGEEKDSKAEDGTPYLTLKMGDMLPVLVKAIQELSAKNDALEARIVALEAK